MGGLMRRLRRQARREAVNEEARALRDSREERGALEELYGDAEHDDEHGGVAPALRDDWPYDDDPPDPL